MNCTKSQDAAALRLAIARSGPSTTWRAWQPVIEAFRTTPQRRMQLMLVWKLATLAKAAGCGRPTK